ncbi:transcription factor BIM1 [Malania oleifera]|uniref:transcription factor BIM1 n=1 Tax=Malania oleifera TaxID=397392 RepID=UPI0025ADDF7D|nr:transcription factor BIM1 [Malania oleifera]
MEIPQPRSFGTEGRKPTHEFLSLYSPVQQDPRPSQGGYLTTHDFLQPLERGGKNISKVENTAEMTSEKPPPLASPTSVEHILPGGIGTYSISHIPSYFNQRVPKPEATTFTVAEGSSTDRNEETSNCSSYTGSGFTLWEESVLKKGKNRKENLGESHLKEPGVKLGQWTTERPSQSSFAHNSSFSSLSSSQPSGQKSQSFIDIIKSVKGAHEEEEYEDEEFILKKEASLHKGDLAVKVDGKSIDQRANTPRSKHSATEQRRRSKINDRFQMLRELIPHSDQKRDKASFLLEVIEYIQFLQEKVHKYEGSCQGWNHEPAKVIPWTNSHRPAESLSNQTRGINNASSPALLFAAKIDENNINVSPTIPRKANIRGEADVGTATTFRGMDHQPGLAAVPLPTSLPPNVFNPSGNSGTVSQVPHRAASDAENTSGPQSQLWHGRSCTTDCAAASDKLKEREMNVEGGTINISSVYSQGLLNTLTKALQSSGVDLSQASISVQIDLGKRANGRQAVPSSIRKDNGVLSDDRAMARSRVSSCGDESDHAQKRLRMSKS